MPVGQAAKAVEHFRIGYAVHPFTLAPLLISGLALLVLHPGTCSATCMRVLGRLRIGFATDPWLIFWLLALLALPFGIRALWQLSDRYRLREAHRVLLRDHFDKTGSLPTGIGALGVAAVGMGFVCANVLGIVNDLPPDGVPGRFGVFVQMLFCWGIFHLGITMAYEGVTNAAATWDLRRGSRHGSRQGSRQESGRRGLRRP